MYVVTNLSLTIWCWSNYITKIVNYFILFMFMKLLVEVVDVMFKNETSLNSNKCNY